MSELGGCSFTYGIVSASCAELPGHVAGLVSAGNQVVNTYSYTPFGEILSASEQVPQPLGYGAREQDTESGMYYLRARYYDPTLARFISEDPIGLAGGINPYAYAGNDPANYTDPYGLDPCSTAVMTIAALGLTGKDKCKSGGGGRGPISCRGPCGNPFGPAQPAGPAGPGGGGGTGDGTQEGPCGGGFTAEQCRELKNAIIQLLRHRNSMCYALGRSAFNRFLFGNALGWQKRGRYMYFPDAPRNLYGEVRGSDVLLTQLAFEDLYGTVVHEEYHVLYLPGHKREKGRPNPNWKHPPGTPDAFDAERICA